MLIVTRRSMLSNWSRFGFNLYLTILVTVLCILNIQIQFTSATIHSPTQTTTGSCVAFKPYSYADIMGGWNEPISLKLLKSANITHFWVDNDDIVGPNKKCINQTQFYYDAPIQRLTNLFTPTIPSTFCQQFLSITLALTQFKKCDPTIDIGTYYTKEQNKPCRWLCDLIFDVHNNSDVCTADDITYLQSFGFDLHQKTLIQSIYPQLQCDNADIWAQEINSNTNTCSTPQLLSPSPTTTQCVQYDPNLNGYCSNVYKQGQKVSIPPGYTQAEIESKFPPLMILLAHPSEDPSCGMNQIRLYCQLLLPECLTDGVRRVPIVGFNTTTQQPIYNYTMARKLDKVLSLPPLAESCHDFVNSCKKAPMYARLLDMGYELFPNCDMAYMARYNMCYPSPVKEGDFALEVPDELVASGDDSSTNHMRDNIIQYTMSHFDGHTYINDNDGIINNFETTLMNYNDNNNDIHNELYHNDDTIMSILSTTHSTTYFNTTQTYSTHQYSAAEVIKINYTWETYFFNYLLYLQPYQSLPMYYTTPTIPTSPQLITAQMSPATQQTPDPTTVPFPLTCPAPLVMPNVLPASNTQPTPNNVFGGRCTLPCPSIQFTSRERRRIEVASLFMITFAMICSGLLTLTFLVFQSQRHKQNLFWFTCSYFCMTLFIFISLIGRNGTKSVYHTQCETNYEISHMKGWGLFQALIVIYFLLATCYWWLIQSIELYSRLVLGRVYINGSTEAKTHKIVLHLFAWITPLLSIIALAVGRQLGYDSYLPFSWSTFDPNAVSRPFALMYIFIFLPLIVSFVIGSTLIIIIAYYFITHDRDKKDKDQNNKNNQNNISKFTNKIERSKSTKFKLQQIIKLFGFTFLMFFLMIMTIFHQANVELNQDKWKTALKSWAELFLLSNGTNPEPISPKVSPAAIIVYIAGLSSPGYFMFILYFILSPDIIGLWLGLFYYKLECQCNCLKKFAKEDITTNTDSDSGSHSSNGSNGTSAHSNDILTGQGTRLKKNKNTTTNTTVMNDVDEGVVIDVNDDEQGNDNHSGNGTNNNNNTIQHDEKQKKSNNINNTSINNASIKNDNIKPIPPPNSSSRSIKQQQQRRTTLFHGFKNKSVLHPPHYYNTNSQATTNINSISEEGNENIMVPQLTSTSDEGVSSIEMSTFNHSAQLLENNPSSTDTNSINNNHQVPTSICDSTDHHPSVNDEVSTHVFPLPPHTSSEMNG